MTTKIVFAAVAALGLLAGPALAKSTAVSAKIATPVPAKVEVIASSAAAGASVWQCAGDTCEARLQSAASVRVCRALAREVGAIVSFAGLTDEQLARCNAGIGASNTASATPAAVAQN